MKGLQNEVRRALVTAGLAGAALCHGGTAAAQDVPAASPTPDTSSAATPTPTPTPAPTASPQPNREQASGHVAAPNPAPTRRPGPAPNREQVDAPVARDDARSRGPRPQRRDHRPRPAATPTPGAGAGAPAVIMPAAVPVGVPDFFIDRFRIPPFLLPIYQAAGTEYGVRWEVLAAINEIETDYGRNLAVSPAGARGWMQFMPSSWRQFGVDANRDGVKDPYDPFDAIFAAARYLRAAGADRDIREAVFAYNHADWYVESVLLRARVIGGMPSDLVGSLTGLVEGRFPVRGATTYTRRIDRARAADASPAARLAGSAGRSRTIRINARAGAPAIAVHDARVVATGHSGRFGRFVALRDAYGNRFTYGHLAGVAHGVRSGMRVAGGRVIGHVARGRGARSHLSFRVRPAGRGAPWIDPTPLLDGWKLLDSTALHRTTEATSPGQVLLLGKGALARRVLADPRLDVYACGRSDIEAGVIDRRVLATLAFLSASGLEPTVTSLRCGHGRLTSSGNVSEHASGGAVDIAAVNGIPISGHQGADTITELTIRRLLTLQGAMRPHQIISLMTFPGAENAFAMSDHADHIHVGWRPGYGAIGRIDASLRPGQWTRLIGRLSRIENPIVAGRGREGR